MNPQLVIKELKLNSQLDAPGLKTKNENEQKNGSEMFAVQTVHK